LKELRHLNKYFFKYKYRLIAGLIITIFSKYLAVKVPQFIRQSLDSVDAYRNGTITDISQVKLDLWDNILWIVGLALASGGLTFLMRQTIIVMSRLIEFDLKNEIYQQYQRLSLSFYKKNRIGDLMNRITEDVNKVRMYLGPAVMYSMNMVVLFSVTITKMFQTDKILMFYALLPLPVLSVAIFVLSKIINKRSKIVQENLSKLTAFTQEMFSGIGVLKAYALERIIQDEFIQLAEGNKQKNINLYQTQALFFPLMILLIGISNILVIYIGGMRYINSEITLGVIAEFILYINMLTWPVAVLGWVTAMIQQAEASQKRINTFLKEKPEIINYSDKHFLIEGAISFKEVTFTYEDTHIKALKGVTFAIAKHKSLAIIGRTGSGKSTIVSLLTRLYDITSGTINLDDRDIKDYNLYDLRSQIGVVPQDAFLFSDTIANNLKIGNTFATDQEIIEVCKKVAFHKTVKSFKDAYQTVLGERGVTLSGGQKQRLAIARALLKKPKILILDDSLSAVDTETEAQILQNLYKDTKEMTLIIISHRVSTVQQADKIIVLENGIIVSQGTHNELINIDGYYKELYKRQLLKKENV
jgi:ATP-binding cassette subfamily B protein